MASTKMLKLPEMLEEIEMIRSAFYRMRVPRQGPQPHQTAQRAGPLPPQ
ncbi:putative DNA-binding transcriptional regulator AlpA [Streptomyces griseorubens]